MTISQLEAILWEYSNLEKDAKALLDKMEPSSIKERYSKPNQGKNLHWVINSESLMGANEVIAIHRHDRFIPFEKHAHDFLEMIFVYAGTIVQEVDNKRIIMEKGDIILLDMNVEHSIELSGENDIAINILIKKEFFDWIFMSQIAYNDLISNFVVKSVYGKQQIKQYLYFKTSENDAIWNIMRSILFEFYGKKNGMETAIRAYILLLFNELLRDYEKYFTEKIVRKIDTSISTAFVLYIQKNYQTVSLKALAEHFSYNPDYISKLVKKQTGKNVSELIRERRMEQAKYLLAHTDLSIAEIVEEVGYSNISYFYKQFKGQEKLTPDEFRTKK